MISYGQVDNFGVFVGHGERGVEGLALLSNKMMWPPSIMTDRGERYQQHSNSSSSQNQEDYILVRLPLCFTPLKYSISKWAKLNFSGPWENIEVHHDSPVVNFINVKRTNFSY